MCASIPSDTKEVVPNENPSFDFSGIAFPSDQLTIKRLRGTYAEFFDHGLRCQGDRQPYFFLDRSGASPASSIIGEMLFSERLIAAFAYCDASGVPGPDGWEGQEGLQGFKDDLVEFYSQLGIASGANHAQELIRDIERQACRMAPDIPR